MTPQRPRLVQKDPPRDTFTTWLWIIAIFLTLTLLLTAAMARGQTAEPTFFACPPEARNGCEARVKAPASPDVDRLCLRRTGTTALQESLCMATTPNAEVRIRFSNPLPGQGHQRYEVVACDDQLGLCSAPSGKLAIAVDLDTPTFFEVLRLALGLGQ